MLGITLSVTPARLHRHHNTTVAVVANATPARASSYQTNSEHVTALLRPYLQGNYSVALYGAPNRVPLGSLKLVWLQLLSERALRTIAAAGGICLLHAKFLFPTFYSPHNPKHVLPVPRAHVRFQCWSSLS